MKTNDHLLLVTAMTCLFAFVPFVYPVCDIGENVTLAYATMNQSIYGITWYECPVKLQRYLVPMILMAEKPFNVNVFGSIDCSRDTFKQIINKGYSCFMMLRHVNWSMNHVVWFNIDWGTPLWIYFQIYFWLGMALWDAHKIKSELSEWFFFNIKHKWSEKGEATGLTKLLHATFTTTRAVLLIQQKKTLFFEKQNIFSSHEMNNSVTVNGSSILFCPFYLKAIEIK